MKLLGKEISATKVLSAVQERLAARGLLESASEAVPHGGVEPRVDPLSFLVEAMTQNADAARGLPIETHRGGTLGRAVVWGKKLFRRASQGFINEALGRQTVFNHHVRDGYAQVSAEVIKLRKQVQELERALRDAQARAAAVKTAPVATPPAAKAKPKPKAKAVKAAAKQRAPKGKRGTPSRSR